MERRVVITQGSAITPVGHGKGEIVQILRVGNGKQLVKQHPDFDSTLCSGQQFIHHQSTGTILTENEILNFETMTSGSGHMQP